MIYSTLFVIFYLQGAMGTSTSGRYYKWQEGPKALANKTNRYQLPEYGKMPLNCLAKCGALADCQAVNVFINGTCEVLLSPVLNVTLEAGVKAYIWEDLTSAMMPGCPDGFGSAMISGGRISCYHFSFDNIKWEAARSYCHRLGGKLASLESVDERDHLISLMENGNNLLEKPFWLSGTDEDQEGKWVWADTGASIDPIVVTPIDEGSDMDCLEVYVSPRGPPYFRAWDCNGESLTICESGNI